MYVQLSEDGSTVVAYFSGPQGSEAWPNVVEIGADDPRYVSYYESLPAGARIGLQAPPNPV
jgi:hypothetical protein